MKHFILIGLLAFGLISCQKQKYALHVVTNDTLILTPMNIEESIAFDSLILKEKSKDLQQFYKTNDFKTGWNQAKNREDLITSIKSLEEDGITLKQFPLEKLKKYNSDYSTLTDVQKTEADILYSETFFKIASQLYNGVLSPKKLYNDWDIDPKNINLPATLNLTLIHDAVPIAFDSIRPKHPVYGQLKEALAELRKMPNEDFIELKTINKLKVNDSLPEIKVLKELLIYWKDLAQSDSINSVFDETTSNALKRFQLRNGIDETGLLDKQTLIALNETKEQQIQKVIVNLERWRWYPRNLGNDYVLVNIPDFSLVAVSHGDTIQKHKIIVGKPDRKTPILSSRFSGLIINPTWTVPPTILKNDLVPSASKNRSYFANRGFTIYDNNGNVVSASDWKPERASSYRYVQKPGKANSLGRIKFDFKNNHLVYLHDTNNKNNFNKDNRDLSSGCIRVEDPFDLAEYILTTENSKYTMKQINQWLESEKTQHIPLQKTIDIHQLYWTAWKDKDGLQFRDDIYNLDRDLFTKLQLN